MSTVHKGLTITVTLDEEKIPYVNGLLFEYRKDLNIYQEKYNKSLPGTFFISWLTLPVQTYSGKDQTSRPDHPDEQLRGQQIEAYPGVGYLSGSPDQTGI
ncbi:MAG: hypothetical protein U5K69_21030 [Balneolaceae bacterium]|nr:hypothetical protein [Balneolaceae bacterium]